MQYIHELQVHFKVISILICNSDILIKIRKNTYITHCSNVHIHCRRQEGGQLRTDVVR